MHTQHSQVCELCSVEDSRPVLYHHAEWSLVSDLHPLCVGHMLLVSRPHVLSFAHLAANTPTNTFFELITSFYHEVFGGIVIYEHGNASENQTKNRSVDHAHIHILPWASHYDKQQLIQSMTVQQMIPGTFDVALAPLRGQAYHAFSWDNQTCAISQATLPSQAFRRAYAEIAQIDTWDWKSGDMPVLNRQKEQALSELQRQAAYLL